MDRLAKTRNSALSSSKNPLIDFSKPDTTTEHEMKKTKWTSKMLFKTFPTRESQKTTPQRKSYGPTTEEVSQWAQSLDNLLSSKYGTIALRLFMKSEHCEENIEFWLACEEFRKTRSRSKLRSRAKTIYKEFVDAESPKQVRFHQRQQSLFLSIKRCHAYSFRSTLPSLDQLGLQHQGVPPPKPADPNTVKFQSSPESSLLPDGAQLVLEVPGLPTLPSTMHNCCRRAITFSVVVFKLMAGPF
ncbi:regulator of G-protein signaling [Pimephales promelas]|nr:regulator of G-protein signaling [Pimephales promelas]